MAFTSVAALIGGQAATAGLVLAAVAEVGVAMSVVGAVTGSKGLTKLGGVLGLVGGIGSMMAGAASGGAAAAGAEAAAGGAEAASFGVLDSAAFAGSEGLQSTIGMFEATDLAGMVDEASNAAFGVLDPAMTPGMEAASSAATAANPAGMEAAETVASEQAAQAAERQQALQAVQQTPDPVKGAVTAQTPTDPAKDFLAKPADPKGVYNAAQDSNLAGKNLAGSALDPKTYYEQILEWVKGNKEVASGLMTITGHGLSGIGAMKQAEMAREANNMRFQYGNSVADYRGRQPNALIGARR